MNRTVLKTKEDIKAYLTESMKKSFDQLFEGIDVPEEVKFKEWSSDDDIILAQSIALSNYMVTLQSEDLARYNSNATSLTQSGIEVMAEAHYCEYLAKIYSSDNCEEQLAADNKKLKDLEEA